MTVDVSNVGSLELPVAQGAALEEFSDPTLLALLDFLGFSLKNDLDSKLSQLTGTSPDACPVANRFPYDPENTFPRNPFPALYAWEEKSEIVPWTIRWDAVKRTIKILYVFDELIKPMGMRARHGLMGAVSKSFAKANERQRHPDFNGGRTLSMPNNLISWKFVSGENGFLSPIPAAGDSGRQLRRGYPAYRAKFEVLEKVDQRDTEDLLADGIVTIETGDNTSSTIEFMQRVMEAPDGN